MQSNGALRTRKRRDDLKLVLEQLVYNLRWSWDTPTVELFPGLRAETLPDGGLRLDATPEAARLLVALFEGLAHLTAPASGRDDG